MAPGAGCAGVSSKAAGVRQLVEVTLNTYHKPIPSAIESNRLVPASGDLRELPLGRRDSEGFRLGVISKFAEDETNSRSETVLMMMMVGGSKMAGIHGASFWPGSAHSLRGGRPREAVHPVGRISQYDNRRCSDLPGIRRQARVSEIAANLRDAVRRLP